MLIVISVHFCSSIFSNSRLTATLKLTSLKCYFLAKNVIDFHQMCTPFCCYSNSPLQPANPQSFEAWPGFWCVACDRIQLCEYHDNVPHWTNCLSLTCPSHLNGAKSNSNYLATGSFVRLLSGTRRRLVSLVLEATGSHRMQRDQQTPFHLTELS